MERNVQRVNGNVERLHSWSPEELQNALGYALVRAAGAGEDVQKVVSELVNRGIEPVLPNQQFTLDEGGDHRTDAF